MMNFLDDVKYSPSSSDLSNQLLEECDEHPNGL